MADSQLFRDITKYNVYGIGGQLVYSSDRSMSTYKQMRNHPIINMGINFTTLGLADAPRVFESEDKEIATILDRMFDPIWKRLIIEATESLSYGWKPFELRYEPGTVKYTHEEEKKVFEGILPRQPRGLDPENNRILIEADGSLKGFEQLYTQGKVLVEDKKCLLIIHQLESGNYYGISMLEPAYSSWYTAAINMQFHTRWLERKGTGIHKGLYPSGKDPNGKDNSEVMLDLLDSLMEGTAVALPSGRDDNNNLMWDIQLLEGNDKTDSFIKFHDYLDKTMLRSLVIPERALTQGEVGARASVEAFTDLFIQRKQSILDTIVDYIDRYFVRTIVDLNWGTEIEVHVKADRLSDESKATAYQIVQKLVEQGRINPERNWLIDKTGIPFEEETPSETHQETPPETSDLELSESRWRAMSKREQKFQLREVDEWLDERVEKFKAEMEVELAKLRERNENYIKKNINVKDTFTISKELNVPENAIKRVVKEFMHDVMSRGYDMYKVVAETGLTLADTPYGFIGFRAAMIADKLTSDLSAGVKYSVSSNLLKGYGAAKVIDSLKQVFRDFSSAKISNVANTEVGEMLSFAKDTYIADNERAVKKGEIEPGKLVEYLQYSAILDEKTCDLCRKMDGVIVDSDSAIAEEYRTPLHYHSRSVWIPITVEEVADPSVEDTELTLDPATGKPFTLNGFTAWLGDLVHLRTFQ
jgi:SPP1 gp7 family putative phage head morphogenesis protein